MKKVREGYKITELGEIPNEWNIADIGKISEFVGSGITPKGGQSVYKKEGIPFIRSQNVYPEGLFLDNIAYIDEQQNEKMKRTQIKDEDILLNITGASIGRCTVVPLGFGKGNVNQHVCIIRTNKEVNPKYISIFINSEIGKKQIDSFNGGSSREGLNFEQVKSIKVPIPILKEQEQISLILTSVDEQIEITNNLIEKTKELKKGLMQKLLTKGIGHSKFKDTEIGKIPEEWEVRKLGEICEVKGGKRLPKGLQLIDDDNGFPYIRVADMYMGGISTDDIKYVPLEAVEIIKNYRIGKEDLFISVAGTIGIVGEVPESLDRANLTENADKLCNIKINRTYLLWVLQSEFIQKIIEGEKTTNAQPKLALTRIKEFIIPIPNKNEQKQIASILSSVDEQIYQYESKKEKLQELKKGLMQKLLTGRIRVQ